MAGLADRLTEKKESDLLTDSEAGRQLGVEGSTFFRWRTGAGISIKQLPGIAEWLGLPMEQVVAEWHTMKAAATDVDRAALDELRTLVLALADEVHVLADEVRRSRRTPASSGAGRRSRRAAS